jgi:hypothetical protein
MKHGSKRFGMVVVVGMVVAATGQSEAGIALDFTDSSPTGTGFPSTWGWTFSLDGTTRVDGLGIWDLESDGLAEDHEVGLWKDDGTLVASITVTNANSTAVASADPSGRWLFVDISPLTLVTGAYAIGAFYGASSDAFRTNASSMILASGVTYGVGGYNSGSSLALQNVSLTKYGDGFFGANFRIEPTISPVPEPTTIALVFTALPMGLGLAWKRRRKAMAA